MAAAMVNLLADSDGAGERADGDLAGEHPLEDLDDESGVLFVELPRGDHGLGEGKTLDLDGRLYGTEADAVVLGAVAYLGKLRCEFDGKRGSVAKDDQRGRLAGLVLQIGKQRGDGVELEAVDSCES